MRDDEYRKYEPFFGKWKFRRELGKGSFGQVVEIYWEDDLGGSSTSALKYIHIPTDEALRVQMEEQPNRDAVRNYFLKQVERIKDEIRILQKCKGHSNIVSYEDHVIIENVGEYGIGWDILIRMELLYPLNPYLSGPNATQYDVVQMWMDIASALVYCDEQNIIHRDIKPANILRASSGRYKLSDFGVARKNMQDIGASTRVGTERYMAPEVFKNEKYDKRADYYSLGCVIYYFLNKKRHVFVPPYPQEVTSDDNEQAERKRISGEKIPRIEGVSKEINDVLLKSMSYRPANRYKSAKDLYRAILHILETQSGELKQKYLNDTDVKREYSSTGSAMKNRATYGQSKAIESTRPSEHTTKKKGQRRDKKTSLMAPVMLAGVMLTAGVGGIFYGVYSKNNARQITAAKGSKYATETVLGTEQGESQETAIHILETLETDSYVRTEPETADIGSMIVAETEAVVETETTTKTETETITETETEIVTETETETMTETETETITETETETMTETETETITETETEIMTETETETITETETETMTETETETITETETEIMTEMETETITETETETMTETETETITETETETMTETETETIMETETEAMTETETETITETETEAMTETETEVPVPTARVIGELERPKSGDSVDTDIKVKGWVLVNDTVSETHAYLDFVSRGRIIKSFELAQKELGGNTFEKRQKKYSADIAAVRGYEVRGSYSLEGISDGTYDINLRVTDQATGEEDILQTVPITVSGRETSGGDIMEYLGLTEEEKQLDTHYIFEDKGFAVGIDVNAEDDEITANADQILLTGWINAEKGTSIGMFLEIDSELYTVDTLAEQDGSFEMTRVPRNLEKMDAKLIGSSVRDTEEAGYIVSMRLPFLGAGDHTVTVSLNIGVPGSVPELIDIKPLTVHIDPSVAINAKAAEKIAQAWKEEFPQPETETETESDKQESKVGE